MHVKTNSCIEFHIYTHVIQVYSQDFSEGFNIEVITGVGVWGLQSKAVWVCSPQS